MQRTCSRSPSAVLHPVSPSDRSLTYLESEHGKYKDTSTFEWSHINITNVYGTGLANRLVWLDCSESAPCHHWKFKNITLVPGKQDNPDINYVCNHVEKVKGIECHPNDSDDETAGVNETDL